MTRDENEPRLRTLRMEVTRKTPKSVLSTVLREHFWFIGQPLYFLKDTHSFNPLFIKTETILLGFHKG